MQILMLFNIKGQLNVYQTQLVVSVLVHRILMIETAPTVLRKLKRQLKKR